MNPMELQNRLLALPDASRALTVRAKSDHLNVILNSLRICMPQLLYLPMTFEAILRAQASSLRSQINYSNVRNSDINHRRILATFNHTLIIYED